jgi:hypothetical protein
VQLAKWGNGRLVALSNVNSSQENQLLPAPRPARIQEPPSQTPALPLGASQLSGGLLEFLWDTDHQTLEEALSEAVRKVTPYFQDL